MNPIIRRLYASVGKLSSAQVVSILSFYFLFILNLSFWKYLFAHIEIQSFSTLLFAVSVPLLVFALLYTAFSVLLVPYAGKPLFFVLLLLSAAVNYLMYQFSVFIDADMVRNTFETHPGEVADLITGKSVFWWALTGLLPGILWLKVRIVYQSFCRECLGRCARVGVLLLCVALLCPFVYKEYASFGRNHKQVRKLVSPFNYIYATWRYLQLEHLHRRPFTKLDETAAHVPFPNEKVTVFVLVLGETARAMNFSLNGYPRETNPQLKQEDIVNFGAVQASGTSTAVAVPAIFSASARKNFNTTDAKYTENLLDLLQQTGYNIYWLENDNGCKGVCARVPNKEMDIQDRAYCDGNYCQDGILLRELEEYLKTVSQDTFIVLHTIGSHGPTYYRRYPEAFRHFTPTCDTENIQTCTREQIVNTYDNTILYADHIAAGVIKLLKQSPHWETGVLYVSDHGESLGENGVYLHGMPYSIAPHTQTTVPMILWMSEAMQHVDDIDYACLKETASRGGYSHDYIFHSILSLMEVDTRMYDPKLDVFAQCRRQPLPRKSLSQQ